jgi:hypothetical protein
MKLYTSEVEFLRDEVDKCHTSMHSQGESLKLLMKAHLDLKKKVERPWVGLTEEEIFECDPQQTCWGLDKIARAIEAKLKEKNHDTPT